MPVFLSIPCACCLERRMPVSSQFRCHVTVLFGDVLPLLELRVFPLFDDFSSRVLTAHSGSKPN